MDSIVENTASRTRSEVGRVPRPGGTSSRRPRATPATIRVTRGPPQLRARRKAGGGASCLLDESGLVRVDEVGDRGREVGMPAKIGVVIDESDRFLPRLPDDLLVPEDGQDPQA